MHIQEHIPLAPYTTFQIGGPARYFVEAASESEVLDAIRFAREHELTLFVLGGGSNLVVSDNGWPGLVLKIGIRGVGVLGSDNRKKIFMSGAGEDWDTLVARTIDDNCAGIECLSGIPGTVGGTPVQNVGAYGQEVSETITSVRVVEIAALTAREMKNTECGFSYRTSIFNSSDKGRYIVTQVSYALTPGGAPRIEYADLKRHFASGGNPALSEVRDAVRKIRASKAMLISSNDPDSRSAGSFFKNPIVPAAEYERIARLPACQASKPPQYPAADGQVKISAAWLVEHAGFTKGYTLGRVGISSKHSLAIVNRGGATAAEIVALNNKVQQGVLQTFGVQLHPEPVFVGF